uniref:Uncharacterized protein n=1 Tax=Oryzias melastigma TaxID=30732 RepID=A0A3B3C0Z6_ORYME
MSCLELRDSASRYRFAQSCLGLAGCVFVCYAVSTPFWLNDEGPGSRESIWTHFLSDGFEHWCAVFGVCPLLDVNPPVLLQHPRPPPGRPGPLPHHSAAAHHGLHILLPPELVIFYPPAPRGDSAGLFQPGLFLLVGGFRLDIAAGCGAGHLCHRTSCRAKHFT